MKRKLGMSAIVVAGLALYLLGVWRLATILGLQGRNAMILRGGLALLGVLVAAVRVGNTRLIDNVVLEET
jgi:hypothetical protein